jgi:FAD/FMN-containing dehydrogenase
VEAVNFARKHHLVVSVRGGGHSIPGFSTCDDGIVIDTSSMKGVRVDQAARRAVAQGGCTWADFDRETQAFGLAVTGGVVSTTGIAGFTLGGGIGWLNRLCGLTCDSLVAADVVTANGDLVHSDMEREPDLLWALKGGGGNFGVVTSFEYALHEVGPLVLGGPTFYPAAEAQSILQQCGALLPHAPDELTAIISLGLAPQVPFLAEHVQGTPTIALVLVWCGEIDAGRAAIEPFMQLGTLLGSGIRPLPYTEMQTLFDPAFPPGGFNYFRSAFLNDFSDSTVKALLEAHSTLPTPTSELAIHQLGGYTGRVASDATAFGTRDKDFILNVVARSGDPREFEACVPWARGVTELLGSDAMGYVNFEGEATRDRVESSYPPATYARLVGVKNQFDPTNMFRLNQNISPTVG